MEQQFKECFDDKAVVKVFPKSEGILHSDICATVVRELAQKPQKRL